MIVRNGYFCFFVVLVEGFDIRFNIVVRYVRYNRIGMCYCLFSG